MSYLGFLRRGNNLCRPSAAAPVRWSSGNQWAGRHPPIVDPHLVNAHHCVVHSRNHKGTLQVLRSVRRGLQLMENTAGWVSAERLFDKSLASTQGVAHHPAAWVAANAMGVSLFMRAKHQEAEELFAKAQIHCDYLTTEGLVNDAYSDVAGVLCDRAANLIEGGFIEGGEDVGEEGNGRRMQAMKMLRRAKFMAERAYRPNTLLLDSLDLNLATALLGVDIEQAHDLVKSGVRMGHGAGSLSSHLLQQNKSTSATEKSTSASNLSLTRLELKRLAVLSLVLAKMRNVRDALAAAARAHGMLSSRTGGGVTRAVDRARLLMCLSSTHWLSANTLDDSKGEREVAVERVRETGVALARVEEAGHLLETARVPKSHPIHLVCRIKRLVLRRCLLYMTLPEHAPIQSILAEKQEFVKEKARCLSSLRYLKRKLGAQNQLVRGLEEAMKEASIQAPPVSRRERATGVAAVARAAINTCSPTPSLEFPVLDVGVGLVDVMRSLEGAVAGGVSRGA